MPDHFEMQANSHKIINLYYFDSCFIAQSIQVQIQDVHCVTIRDFLYKLIVTQCLTNSYWLYYILNKTNHSDLFKIMIFIKSIYTCMCCMIFVTGEYNTENVFRRITSYFPTLKYIQHSSG